ncbi:baseplate J/gp47 family protein [Serratia proteamaculans]|uniref:Baseplate J/gp47 family protein n=1 Tax=Serratia proteamaculans TaxID=28151 RepID=A0ABS0TY75_SERPR|nr:baseplate J/gp47 family protein [Serratia proteamaculans]MBI6182398.1 baseplate J/gp47 family protein [Serratia proteamaculans]
MSDTPPSPDYLQILQDSGMPVTQDEINTQFQQDVDAQGIITNTSSMSPFWRLITGIITKPVMWLWNALANTVLANLFVATASGTFLDLHAWQVNISRKPATAAGGVIAFTKTDAGTAITVKAGTLIQTERINGNVYQVAVAADTVIPAGTAVADITVNATESGEAYNLAPGYYRILPVAVAGIASVRNNDNWLVTPGADPESDDDLRARVRNQFNVVGNYHIDAVYRAMIASVSGLSVDRIFFLHDAPRGPGTANAYLLLDTGVASQPFIDTVNNYINQQGNHGHGDDLQCFPMPETQHQLDVVVYVPANANLSDTDRATLKANVENLVRCAFRENDSYAVEKTWPDDRFSFSRLGEELHDTFAAIKSLHFSLDDITSNLDVPRLQHLTVEVQDVG